MPRRLSILPLRFDFVAAAGLVGAKMALRTLSLSSRYAGFYGLSGRIAQYGLHLMLVYLCCTELAVPVMPVSPPAPSQQPPSRDLFWAILG